MKYEAVHIAWFLCIAADVVAAITIRGGLKPSLQMIQPADLIAFYINMPDRPGRRAFAEEQYHKLGIPASRVEGVAKPDKLLGGLFAWQHAVDACAKANSSVARYCLIAEDDAVYRPFDSEEAKKREKYGYPAWNKGNTTAIPDRFFSALTNALAAMPKGVDGPWTGLHLCTLGEMITLSFARKKEIVEGNPWPNEKFSRHKIYPGAPDVLLLQRRDAELYKSTLDDYVRKVQVNRTRIPIDVLQSKMYTDSDAVSKAGGRNAIMVLAAENPQLCQHLTDFSNEARYRSSVGDGASARSPGAYTNMWGSKTD